ncbi:MAG TPA: T9SS type A sorting domain-containing protein [Bacteroidales bacterium]|nr:T9SS type A sorting domain-containing protein [Bacteroidales bacterium]
MMRLLHLILNFQFILFTVCIQAQPGSNDLSFNPEDIGFGNGDGAGGYVYSSVIQPDGKIILVGEFKQYNGSNINYITRLNSDGSIDKSFHTELGPDFYVYSCIVQSDGKIVIGGGFSKYDGISKNRICRLNPDGSLDNTFNIGTGANGNVLTLQMQPDGKILAGGSFTTFNGIAQKRIVRLNPDGSVDNSFNIGTGPDNSILSIALQGIKILIAGSFTQFNSSAKNRLARLNLNGSVDTTFHCGTGADSDIKEIVPDAAGKIILVGSFKYFNKVSCNSIVRLNTDGTIDNTFLTGTGANRTINTVKLLSNGKLIIGGDFTVFNSTSINRIACLKPDGSIDNTFWAGTGSNATVNNLSVQPDNKIVMVGQFTEYNETSVRFVTRITSYGDHDNTFNKGSGANGVVSCFLFQPGGKTIVTGNFTRMNGQNFNRICRINADGTTDYSFISSGANNSITKAILQSDNKIIIIGNFTAYTGISRIGIARIYNTGSIDNAFNAGFDQYNSILDAVIQPDGKILISVNYHNAMINETAYYLRRLYTDGKTDYTYNTGTGADGPIRQIARLSNGKFIISGSFSSYKGVKRNGIAQINSDGTIDDSFNPGKELNGTISAMVLQPDGKIIIAGAFGSVSGIKRINIARLNQDGTLDYTFNPGEGPNSGLNSISIQPDNKIILTGTSIYNGHRQFGITRINQDGTLDLTFNPGSGANKYGTINSACIQNDGKILIGGNFISIDNVGKNRIARLIGGNSSLPAAPFVVTDTTFNRIDKGFDKINHPFSIINKIVVQPDGKILCSNGVNTGLGEGIVRLNTDGTFDYSFYKGRGPNERVRDIALQPDGKIIIAGYFTEFNSLQCKYIARLNSDGSIDPSFNTGSGANNKIYALSIQNDGRIIFGGECTSYNSANINSLARLNYNGSLDTTFKPAYAGTIYATTLQPDGRILVTTKNGLVRLNENGSKDGTFNVVLSGTSSDALIQSVSLQSDGKIIIGGYFSTVNGSYVSRIARLNTDGSLDVTFKSTGNGAGGNVFTTGIQPDGKIVIGGDFTSYNSITNYSITRLNPDGSLDSGFAKQNQSSYFYKFYTCAILPDGRIIAAGSMSSTLNIFRPSIIRLLSDGELDYKFIGSTGASWEVKDIALQKDGKIIIAGLFDSFNGTKRTFLARLHIDGSLDETFDAKIHPDGGVYNIAVQDDGKVLIAGEFKSINGVLNSGIARLNSDGSLDNSFSSQFSGPINAMALQDDGKIIIAATNPTIVNVLRLKTDGSIDTSFSAIKTNNGVKAIKLQKDGKIIIAGGFSKINTFSIYGIARLHSDGSLDNTFISYCNNGIIYTISIQADNKIIAGGSFSTYDNLNIKNLVRLNPDGTADRTFRNKGVDNPVYTTLIKPNGKIVIGGDFEYLNENIPRNHIAFLTSDGDPDPDYPLCAGANQKVCATALQPDGKIVIGGDFTCFNGMGKNRITRISGESFTYSIQIETPARFCKGQTDYVKYVSEGIYKTGNIFTAQLSDSTGSFIVPTILGNKFSSLSDTLQITIPDDIPDGNGYRIRVVSSDPEIAGADNGSDITINSLPEKPVIVGSCEVCSGENIQLGTDSSVSRICQWILPNDSIIISPRISIENAHLSDSGNYIVEITDISTGCSADVSSIHVIVNELPLSPVISSNSPLCPGNDLVLTANDQERVSFYWTGPNHFISDKQNPVIEKAGSFHKGTYSLIVKDTVTGCTNTGITEANIFMEPLNPLILNESDYCVNDSITLFTENTEGVSFIWNGPDGFYSNAVDPVIAPAAVNHSGFYFLRFKDNNSGCYSNKDSVSIIVNELPGIPVISYNEPVYSGDTVVLSTPLIEGVSYQWTGPGNLISESQNLILQNVVPEMQGLYSLILTNTSTLCKSLPQNIYLNIELNPVSTDIIFREPVMELFPNPVKENININIKEEGIISIVELAGGKTIFRKKMTPGLQQIIVQNWSKGMYYITFQNNKKETGIKFVISE